MSQENVEVVRRFIDAFTRRDDEAVLALADPEISWRAAQGEIDDVGEMLGRDALRRHVEDWFEMFDDLTVVAEEVIDAGEDRVVAVHRMTGRAKVSGIETEIRFSVVYTLRDEKIVRGREYIDKGQALEAVGLRE